MSAEPQARDYLPAPLTPEEAEEAAAELESREAALEEIARALYWKAVESKRLRARREHIIFGCDFLRRRLRRLPIERPAITFYSIHAEGKDDED